MLQSESGYRPGSNKICREEQKETGFPFNNKCQGRLKEGRERWFQLVRKMSWSLGIKVLPVQNSLNKEHIIPHQKLIATVNLIYVQVMHRIQAVTKCRIHALYHMDMHHRI